MEVFFLGVVIGNGFLLIDVKNLLFTNGETNIRRLRMDEEEDDLVLLTNHKLFPTFSQCVHHLQQQHKQRWKPMNQVSAQVQHHSSVVGDHIHISFMFVVFMHFSYIIEVILIL